MVSFSSFADELVKIASEDQKPPHPALIIGSGLAGLGVGFGAGHLTMQGLNHLARKKGGIPTGVMRVAPALAGLAGMGVSAHQAYMWDKAMKAHEARSESGDVKDT